MTQAETKRGAETRTWIARQFTRVEDVVYVALVASIVLIQKRRPAVAERSA